VADPATGVAVYQTYGGSGWDVYGGTSASAPIITSAYAVAGSPAPGTYPNSYPYTHPAALNDVTTGNNGSCTPQYLCTAGSGFDGPTGLGTPNGVAAFTSGPHGMISGMVSSAVGGPVVGAVISAGGLSATTDSSGAYSLDVPVGTYTVTASAYGYAGSTTQGVAVADGAKVRESFSLSPVPRHVVSGTVTDGGGHGWPLYAKITADGVPGGPVFTDPVTGKFSLDLPQGHAYTLTVSAVYPGYQQLSTTVTVAGTDQTLPIALPVDRVAETAPGYAVHRVGTTQTFDSTTQAPPGWRVVNAPGSTGGWTFNDPGQRTNLTGGTGGFAIVDSKLAGASSSQDSQLISPVYDLSKDATPRVSFDTNEAGTNQVMVDATTDGGAIWTNVWKGSDTGGPRHIEVSLAQYARTSNVQLRFHYVGHDDKWWELDDIFVGNRSYDPVPGGMVVGTVADANTGAVVNGAEVVSKDAPAESALTSAAPADPHSPGGFYWMFSSTIGKHPFTAAKPYFATATQQVKVAANAVVWRSFKLKAGRLTIDRNSIDAAVGTGSTRTVKLVVRNDGSAPATLTLSSHPNLLPQLVSGGAPLKLVAGTFSPLSMKTIASSGAGSAGAEAGHIGTEPESLAPAGTAWKVSADLPTALTGNMADFYDGRLYTGLGWSSASVSDVRSLYSYNPATGAWFQLASAADSRDSAVHGFIADKLYVAGGWGGVRGVDPKLEIYNPRTDTWSVGAPMPTAYGASGSAVLDDKLYAVGGCYAQSCIGVTDVQVYDPHTDTWSRVAPYPEPISWPSCGAIAGKLYCAGGTSGGFRASSPVKHAYVYDPSTNHWSAIADLPVGTWGDASSAANGELLISGGVIPGPGVLPTLTNQGYAYNPVTNSWTALPNANETVYRGAGAVGFYVVGGQRRTFATSAVTEVALLPGYSQNASPISINWLSESSKRETIAPGRSATVLVTLNAAVPGVVTFGDYTAALSISADIPYPVRSIPVAMHVGPAGNWARITGAVLGSDGHGHLSPLAGATVMIRSGANGYTLATTQEGMFSLWLPVSGRPVTISVIESGFKAASATAKIADDATTVCNFVLKPAA
jgi:N-acetylneuraminic acid mutarotase